MLDFSFPNPKARFLNNLEEQVVITKTLALLQEHQVQMKKRDLALHPLAQCSPHAVW